MNRKAQPEPTGDDSGYKRGVGRLIEFIRQVNKATFDVTAHRKEVEAIAQHLEETARLLAGFGPAQMAIELAHNESGEPSERTGVDGRPVRDHADPDFCSYLGIRLQVGELAKSARIAAAALPDSREKFALPLAALGLLHLRRDFNYPPPTLYDGSPVVLELDRICRAAGIVLSPERLRGALRGAMDKFDPYFIPLELKKIYR